MLQGKEWFDLYLNSFGFIFIEYELSKCNILNFLMKNPGDLMIGLNLSNGKHSVIFKGFIDNNFNFMNVRRENTNEPNTYSFKENELLSKLDESIYIGLVKKADYTNVIDNNYLYTSLQFLAKYETDLLIYCYNEHEYEELKEAQNKIFAALLLDVYSMMLLICKNNLAEKIKALREEYMTAMKLNRKLILSKHININLLKEIISDYKIVIKSELT